MESVLMNWMKRKKRMFERLEFPPLLYMKNQTFDS